MAGGWKGVIWAVVGDLEYMVARLNLPHFGQKQNPCGLCRCSGDDSSTSWRNCKPTAPWLGLQWSLAEWRSFPDRPQNPLFNSGVCSALSCHMDYMHCMVRTPVRSPRVCGQQFALTTRLPQDTCGNSRPQPRALETLKSNPLSYIEPYIATYTLDL